MQETIEAPDRRSGSSWLCFVSASFCQSSALLYNLSAWLSSHTDFILAVRAQKSVGLVGGPPTYDLVEAFQAPDATARTYQYSPDGRLFALAVPSGCVRLQYSSKSTTDVIVRS